MRLLYTIGIWLYATGIRVAALFGHTKARQMVRGWKTENGKRKTENGVRTVWFHASSLGEFEQARPVLEEYRRRHEGCRVVLTFFSPSGYEVRKGYAMADVVMYLPPDTPRNARRLVRAIGADEVFFVKYDFWYNYLDALRRSGARTYIFSAIFRPGQYFFRPWGRWFIGQVGRCFDHVFVQDEASLRLLRAHGIGHASVAGDTRFDRVHQIALAAEADAVVEAFLGDGGGPVVVCGSTWPPDERLLDEVCAGSGVRLIVAPHVIAEEHLRQVEALFPQSIRYSKLKENIQSAPGGPLIIDNIGILSKLYRYANVAYIGGGFGVGIHNILEAVTFGRPVVFGPNYAKFKEARDIIERGGGWSVGDAEGLRRVLHRLLGDDEARHSAAEACRMYMEENLGSTDVILEVVSGQ